MSECTNQHYLIIGGGPSGLSAAETLRHSGFTGRLTILSKENYLPYDRTFLSKTWDNLEQETRNQQFLDDYSIQFQKQARVTSIDENAKQVQYDQDGEVKQMKYDKLLIATGGRPKKLQVEGRNLTGLFELREKEDVKRIQNFTKEKKPKRILLVGGGFIAYELSSTLRQMHKEADIKIINRNGVLFEK